MSKWQNIRFAVRPFWPVFSANPPSPLHFAAVALSALALHYVTLLQCSVFTGELLSLPAVLHYATVLLDIIFDKFIYFI